MDTLRLNLKQTPDTIKDRLLVEINADAKKKLQILAKELGVTVAILLRSVINDILDGKIKFN